MTDEWRIWRRCVPVWGGLAALLAATVVLAYLPLGRFNTISALVIAGLKALLVALFFMHLRRPDPLLRLTGAAGLLWLCFLFAISFADLMERRGSSQPGTLTPRVATPEGPVSGTRGF
jgi:caa(3)-type oxidase subunit IV